MDSADVTSGQVSNENIFPKDSDEAKVQVRMNSTENTSGQFQKRISLSICSESETSSGMDNNLSVEEEEPKDNFTSESICNSENKLHTPTDEPRSLKDAIALPECFSSGRNKKRALPRDDNELDEENAEEGKRPTAKKIRTDDQSECVAANDEIMEERNELGQSIGEKLRHSAKDHDNEVKRDDAAVEEKPTTVNDRTGNESGYKAVEDEIMEEKNEFRQNIDEESLHLAEEHELGQSIEEKSRHSAKDHDNEVKRDDAAVEEKPTTVNDRTGNESGYKAVEDEIMEEKNEFRQNIDEESLHLAEEHELGQSIEEKSRHSAKDHDNEVKRDDAAVEEKPTTVNDRTGNESGYKAVEDEIMEEKNEFRQNIDEESLHLAEEHELGQSIEEKSRHSAKDHDNEVKRDDAAVEEKPTTVNDRTGNESGYKAVEDEIMEEKNEFRQNIDEESLHLAEEHELGQSIEEKSRHSAKDHDNEVKRDDAAVEEKPTTVNVRTGNQSGCKAVEDEIMKEKNEFRQNIDEESLHLAEEHNNKVKEDAEKEQNPTAKENETDNQSGYMVAEDEIMEERNGFMQNTGEELQHSAEDYDDEVKQDDAEEQHKLTAMEDRTANESEYMTAEDEIMEEEDESIENIDEESLHSAEDQEEVMSISDYDENEHDLKDENGLDYDNSEDDHEDDDEDNLDTFEAVQNVPLNEFDKLDPLTDEEEFIVKLALSEKYRNKVLVEHTNIDRDITGRLLECLRPEHQLTSDLVDVYLQLLKERERNNPKKFLKCHFFNSSFYEWLEKVFNTGDLESIMRKTEKLEYRLIDCDKIFVPIYDSIAHWEVITIDIKQKRIRYLNSILSGMNHQAISLIARYIKAEAKQRGGIDLDTDSWEKEAPANIPSQENKNDTGVFMLKYMDYINRNLPLYFNQENIPLFRKKILIEILNMPGASSKFDLDLRHDDENATDKSSEAVKPCNTLSIEGMLKPLNEAEKVKVQFALWKKYRELVLVKHPNIGESITGGLLQCLRPNQWLSSDIINVYLAVLKEREKNDPKSFLKCHFFNTFFYTSLYRDLKTKSITSIMRKTRRLEYQLVNCDKIFVPINENGDHWVVVVVDIQKKKIQYLDSLLGENRQAMKVIAWYIKEEAKQKSKIDLDTESWKMEFPKNIPTQRNNYDCGVFMLKYIDFLSSGLPMNFQQRHIPLFREKMVLEILNITGYSNRINLE